MTWVITLEKRPTDNQVMEKRSQQNAFLLFASPWQKLPFFQGLPPEVIRVLLDGSALKTTKNRDLVFKQDEPADSFIFVVEGLFRLYRTNPKGQRVIMDFVGTGGMVGGLLMAQQQSVYPISCQSIGPGQILKIPQSTYLKSWISSPEIMRRTQNANLERMQALHQTRELHRYPLEEKIREILLRMSAPEDQVVPIRILKTDLADLTGSCVESVIRIFSSWDKKGWLEKKEDGTSVIRKSHLSGEQSA